MLLLTTISGSLYAQSVGWIDPASAVALENRRKYSGTLMLIKFGISNTYL
jgi:hypothetical protein